MMIRKVLHTLSLLLGVREAYKDSAKEGLVDFSGQGGPPPENESFFPFTYDELTPEILMHILPMKRPWYIRLVYHVGLKLCKMANRMTRKWRKRVYNRYARRHK